MNEVQTFLSTAFVIVTLLIAMLHYQGKRSIARTRIANNSLLQIAKREAYYIAREQMMMQCHPRYIKSSMRLVMYNRFGIRGTEASEIVKQSWHDACLVRSIEDTTRSAMR